MKILQLVTRRQFRGAEVFAANLSRELIANGQKIIFAGLYAPPEKALKVDNAINEDISAVSSSFISLAGVRTLAALIRREQPDVIQANGSDTLKYALAARMISGYRPVIYRNISIISTWVGSAFVKKAFYTWLFKKVDHVSSVGNESRNDFIRFFNYPENKISVIRRGIAAQPADRGEVRKKLESEFGLEPKNKIVTHVGNFSKEKNHKFLLDVFSKIKMTDPDIKLVFVGEGELFENIRQEISRRSLERTIFLAGFRQDVENVLAGADLFVLCSFVEGVPGVVLEAASYKIPSLSVNVGGIGEVVKDNETGVLLPSHDVNTFAAKILKMLGDKESLVRMGENAYTFASDEFNPERNALKFIDLYKSLIR
jgi:glycosyltransferase involved in cell wall biosynthesis